VILALCVQGEKYIIDEGIEVVATPGHTAADVSLIVQNTANATVLVAGKFSQCHSCALPCATSVSPLSFSTTSPCLLL